MALPIGGTISASMINTESATVSTNTAPMSGTSSTPQPGSLVKRYNNATPTAVNQVAPHAYSEFYGKSFTAPNIPCGGTLNAGSGNGYFEATVTSGNPVGAVVIYFNPAGVPDGVAYEYNSTTYNDLTSNTYGYAAGTGNNLNIVGDDDRSNCTASDLATNSPYTLNTSIWNGSSFGLNGGTTTVVTTNTNLNGTVGGIVYTLVVPKTDLTPTTGTLKIVGPCTGTAWGVKVLCPAALPSFTTNSVNNSSQGACCAAQNQTYYFARNATNGFVVDTNTLPQIGNFVFSDSNGANVLLNGYYRTTSSSGVYVQSGVVYDTFSPCSGCVTAFDSSILFRDACGATLNQVYYHNGINAIPVTGDTCYSNSAGTTTLSAGQRADTAFGIYIVNSSGVVTSKSLCP